MSGKFHIGEDGTIEKRCPRCKDYWPADSEFFYSTGDKGDGLTSWCKACYIEWRYPGGRGSVDHQVRADASKKAEFHENEPHYSMALTTED